MEVPVERVFEGAWWIAGDHGRGVLVGDRLAEVIAIIGGVGHDDLGGQTFDQPAGLRHMPGG